MGTTFEVLTPWEELDAPSARRWERRLAERVLPGHPLRGLKCIAVAHNHCACVIFRLVFPSAEYAVVNMSPLSEKLSSTGTTTYALYTGPEQLMTELVEPQHARLQQELREFIQRRGHFSVCLAPMFYKVEAPLRCHESVLRPLLRIASQGYVYGVSQDSAIWPGSGLLHAERGRHRIAMDGEPIVGHERFWNAGGGRRGSVVFLCSEEASRSTAIFKHTSRPGITYNMGAGHTPSAVRFARRSVASGGTVAILLPRNNGIEYMDVIAEPGLAVRLFDHACSFHTEGPSPLASRQAEPAASLTRSPPSLPSTSPDIQTPASLRTPPPGGCG